MRDLEFYLLARVGKLIAPGPEVKDERATIITSDARSRPIVVQRLSRHGALPRRRAARRWSTYVLAAYPILELAQIGSN